MDVTQIRPPRDQTAFRRPILLGANQLVLDLADQAGLLVFIRHATHLADTCKSNATPFAKKVALPSGQNSSGYQSDIFQNEWSVGTTAPRSTVMTDGRFKTQLRGYKGSGDLTVTVQEEPGKNFAPNGVNLLIYPLARISRALSRCQSRCFSVSRLSWSFLPLATPSRIFAIPLGLKYRRKGMSVMPSRRIAMESRFASFLCTRSFRVRFGS